MILGWFRDVLRMFLACSRRVPDNFLPTFFDQKNIVQDGVSNWSDGFRELGTGTGPAWQLDYRHQAKRAFRTTSPRIRSFRLTGALNKPRYSEFSVLVRF